MRGSKALAHGAVLMLALGAGGAAQANWMDFLFGKRAAETEVSPTRRTWEIGEFTAIRLVPREPGSAPNAHPATVSPEGLRQQLATLRVVVGSRSEPLFGSEELADLVEPITQALSVAGPGDDLLLLSTNRRGEGFLSTPTGITARLFMQDGRLQMIVRDARLDFVNLYRGTRITPVFIFGSRAAAGPAVLQAPPGGLSRADWASLALTAPAAVPMGVAPAPMPTPGVPAPAPAPAAAGATAAPAPMPAPAPPAAPPRVRDNAFFEEQEARLRNLKRLRDGGLITEEEYQQKRREILQTL